MYKFVSIAVISAVLFPAAAGAQSFSRVLAGTDPALAAGFSAALGSQAVLKASAPSALKSETKAAYDAFVYVPVTRPVVFEYDFTSNKFQGKRTLRIEYGPYSQSDGLVTVTMTFVDRSNPWTTSFLMQASQTGIMSAASPLGGGARLEMPNPVVYNQSWDEGSQHSRVAAVNTTSTVPAGSYKGCVRIFTRVGNGEATINRYYAPGVGLVMEQHISADRQESISLASYRFK